MDVISAALQYSIELAPSLNTVLIIYYNGCYGKSMSTMHGLSFGWLVLDD
jgi:hypothetical protein